MTNPETNFNDHLSEYDQSFHITTYDFGPPETDKMVKAKYSTETVTQFIKGMKDDPLKAAKAIDTLTNNDLKPLLKCSQPCYTCKDADSSYCTSCWGPGANNDFTLTFLQREKGKSTCQAQCSDKYTVNGYKVETKGTDGNIVPAKTYFRCSDCDVTCGTCKGQTELGVAGDNSKCLTCAFNFKYYLASSESCMVTCPAGFYFKNEKPWTPQLTVTT